jgi:23S rRNA A2030 N6-methylase RlmJ
MANRHYANLGDVWKHLPLGEILVIEAPTCYLETHAGSATYRFERSPDREYGALRFLDRCGQSGLLRSSRYAGILRDLMNPQSPEPVYPGSPYLSLSLLAHSAERFVFCDLDEDSLADIRGAARSIGIPGDAVECIRGDGIEAVDRIVSQLPPADRAGAFVLIDGYSPFDSIEGGRTCIELFSALASLGIRAMLWYGFHADSTGGRPGLAECRRGMADALAGGASKAEPWCVEVRLAAMGHRDFDADPGVHGCGILCANLQPLAAERCAALAEELARIYHGSELAGGWSGALEFETIRFEKG